ncbi:MAG: alanine racemase [Desulfuromonadaceae bacterium]|nr:alanine racemase [Desulfuromonas sp.]MDY0184516.1 alanine racemase [Desulfuromonadaceae bacterium]
MHYAHRPTRVEIDLGALRHNFTQLRRSLNAGIASGHNHARGADAAKANVEVLAVVKADAYGHGAVPVAQTLQDAGVSMFGVAIAEEGLELRRAGIVQPILMLGGAWPGQEDVVLSEQMHTAVFELDQLERLNCAATRQGRRCNCHIKLDTGMGRLGLQPEELPPFLAELKHYPNVDIVGVMSHLALADEPESPLNARQMEIFARGVEQIRAEGYAPRYIHAFNSAASFSPPCPMCNLVRPGLALYGGQPLADTRLDLRPVMNFRSKIAHLKWIPVGRGVSYGQHFIATRPTLIAAVPVGYADGYNRLLSNGFEAIVGRRKVPVAGNVCMDWIMLDVTDVPDVAVHDDVTLLGCEDEVCVFAEDWAERIGSISYEVFCQVSKRVPRVYLPGSAPGPATAITAASTTLEFRGSHA